MTRQSFYGSLAALAALALAGCVDREAQAQAAQTRELIEDQTVPVEVVEARLDDVAIELDLTGSIATDDDVSVSAKVPGRLVAVYVTEGQQVSPGTVVARQETNDALTRLRQAQAQTAAARSQLEQTQTEARVSPSRSDAAIQASEARVRQAQAALQKALNGSRTEERRQAKANLDRAKSDLDTAQKARDRAKRLLDQGAIAQQDFERAENQYQSALAGYTSALESYNLVLDSVRPEDIESAREAVRQAEAQLEADRANKRLDPVLNQRVDAARANLNAAIQAERLAQQGIDDLTITAPMSGRVSGVPLKAGTFVNSGTPIARLIGTAGVYYEAEVPERYVNRLQVGMSVTAAVDALGGATVSGTVASVDPLASDLGRLYKVRVSLNESLDRLKPGMFAAARVELGRETDVVTVPTDVVIRDGERAYVFVANGDKAERREVQTGVRKDGAIVVDGVRAGERVISRGRTQVLDGSTIRIESAPSAGSAAEEN